MAAVSAESEEDAARIAGEDQHRSSWWHRLLGTMPLPCGLTWGLAHSPRRYNFLVLLVVALSVLWLGFYVVIVLSMLHVLSEKADSYCRQQVNQHFYHLMILLACFVWSEAAQICIFSPCIARLVEQACCCGTSLFIREGPICLFGIGSFFWLVHLMMFDESCENGIPWLSEALRLYAMYSCMMSTASLVMTSWHKSLIQVGRPAKILENLQTCTHNDHICLQRPECIICLSAWEPDDLIKVTKCQHAYHADCLGRWLQTSHACALCRQKIIVSP
mmetsp:Transcript_73609/g.157878  ORF Transcript_73609/g.157878 Transcript_73609/m.157878 type:complete len:275 (-) Transcript_73609:132-956(-)